MRQMKTKHCNTRPQHGNAELMLAKQLSLREQRWCQEGFQKEQTPASRLRYKGSFN